MNSLNDWEGVKETLPTSCCPMRNETEIIEVTVETPQNATCTEEDAFEKGCKKLVTEYLNILFHPVTVGVIVVLTIQVCE